MKLAPAEKMNMQMVNALSAVLARIYNKAEACLYAKLFGNRGCNLHKMAHERAVVNHGNTPQEAATHKPTVLFVDQQNAIVRKAHYEKHGLLEAMED